MNNLATTTGQSLHGFGPDRMGDITLKQVRGFLAGSACTTFKRAAQQVFLSQAAFCRAIQELESSVGEELFVRSSHGIKLSSAGEAFLPYAQRLMNSYDAVEAGMDKWRAAGRGQLMLAGSHIVMSAVLPMLFSRLHANIETTTLMFESCTSQQVLASVLQGRADCGVCNMLVNQPDLHCVNLLQAPLGLLFNPNFALPASICTLADLKNVKLVRFGDDSIISQLLQRHAPAFDAYHAAHVVCSNMSSAYAMVQDAQVAVVTSGIGATHPQAKGLQFVPLPDLLPFISVNLITRRDAHLDDQQALMKELTRVCVLEAPWHPSVELKGKKSII
jgi:DNA-binding transcriptional LysR family regulator